MSREIKFRAFEGKEKGMMESDKFDSLASFFGYYREQFYFDEEGAKDVPFMQFTGLKDKNGNDIYEGDVVNIFGGTFPYRVSFDVGSFGYYIDENQPQGYFVPFASNENFEWVACKSEEIIVIGNIYKNPELIKQAAT